MTPLRAKYIRDLVIRGRSKNTQEAYTRCVRDLARYYHRSPELISYEEGHGLAAPSHQGAPTGSLQRQHRRERRALSLRRDTWPRDARLDGIGPAHEARHPARGSRRAQRGRSDLDCAQTAAGPGALDDGLWLRAANFGGHTAQDQRHRPRPYAVASTRRQGRQGTRSAIKRAFAQRVSKLLASATSG